MRFWTLLQEPLFQAALVENGKIVRTIPDHPPKTPVRFIAVVGEYKDKLILSRLTDHQIWSLDGKTHEYQLYTPYVYSAHWVGEFNGFVLAGSGGLDVTYLMDFDGNIVWEWWMCDHSERPEDFRSLMKRDDWLAYQTNRRLPDARICGLNSIHKQGDGSILITMMRINTGICLVPGSPSVPGPYTSLVTTKHAFPHDIQIDQRNSRLVYGAQAGLIIDEEVALPCAFVKRVKQIEGGYIITYESGAVITDMDGKEKQFIPLPRPFGVFHLEL